MKRTIATTSIIEMTKRNKKFHKEINSALRKFMWNDWGDTPEDDIKRNQQAMELRRGLVLGCYQTSKGYIHVFTDENQEKTTICFSDEYVN